MSRSTLTPITHTSLADGGYNLTDSSDFTTLTAGSGNGVELPYDGNDLVILQNDTGGDATFTIDAPESDDLDDVGGTVTSPTIVVEDGKTYVLPPLGQVFKQSDDKVYIDCDVAGKILVLNG